ncbi:MAG: type IV toxin-antitoxin system AbiEi family antitoxin domain-containing protein [Spirochaetes bacterium]|nr:type IV toxin-antitoxin system AbiEi family antitoxin domain-containing protein [Spirochaetota bacterium]
MSKAIKCGITRYMLYSLWNKGMIGQVNRGIYRFVELHPISNPDLITIDMGSSAPGIIYDPVPGNLIL